MIECLTKPDNIHSGRVETNLFNIFSPDIEQSCILSTNRLIWTPGSTMGWNKWNKYSPRIMNQMRSKIFHIPSFIIKDGIEPEIVDIDIRLWEKIRNSIKKEPKLMKS